MKKKEQKKCQMNKINQIPPYIEVRKMMMSLELIYLFFKYITCAIQ